MTENQTTELRKKLTERGIEFATDDFDHLLTTIWWVDGIFAKYLEGTSEGCWCEDDPTLKIRMKRITPEQAIAATLGWIDESDTIRNELIDGGLIADVLAPVCVDEKERRAFERGRVHERFAQQVFKEATS